jgi:hypothetical protein
MKNILAFLWISLVPYCGFGAVGGWNWNVNINDINYSSSTALGTFDQGALILKGGWLNSWQNGGDDVCHGIIEYVVTSGGPSGSLMIDYVAPHAGNPGDKYHSNQNYSVNISNMAPGNYTLMVNYKLYGRFGGVSCTSPGTTNSFTTSTLATQTYTFTIQSTPLPVVFLNVKGIIKADNNVLIWNTQKEENNSHFDVESSMDGSNFQIIGRVYSNAFSKTYQFEHKTKEFGVYYYRIKQVDFDGNYTYTLPISLYRRTSIASVENWVAHDKIRIFSDNIIQYKIINSNGLLMCEKSLAPGENFVEINDFPPGIYIVTCTNEFESITKKIVKASH